VHAVLSPGDRRRRVSRRVSAIAAVAAASLLIAACSSSSSPSGSSSGSATADIKIGQIDSISGGYPFGDAVAGAQSYVAMVNAAGGIHGHKIVFESGDDKGQASEAATLARKFVEQDGDVALIGDSSLPECPTNQGYYTQNKVPIVGTGAQPQCFAQPFFQPVNAGPYIGHEVMWDYTFSQLKPASVCQLEQNDPTSIKYYDQLRAEFVASHPGAKFTEVTYVNDASKDPTPAVTQAKQAGCDLIMLSTVAPNLVAFVKAAKQVGLDATFMCLGSCYDASVPKTLGALGEPGALGPKDQGVFVAAELAPINDPSPDVQAMVAQFKKTNTPADFWSEIGWLSMAEVVNALTANKGGGDITTSAGVVAALQKMDPYTNGLAATPLIFGTAQSHAPNLGSKMLLIKNGDWTTAPGQGSNGFTIVKAPTPPN